MGCTSTCRSPAGCSNQIGIRPQTIARADLHRRESVHATGLPQADRTAGLRWGAHRRAEVRRAARIRSEFVRRQSPVPICTGENLYTRQGFLKLIELQGCDGVHIDVPKSGGLLESKRISDLADNYYIWTAAHNPASPVGTIASAHAAASMRNFRIHELANYVDWWPDLVIHEGPIWENGYLTIQDKPGYGIELNPDVARAHLAPGETWWG